MTNPYIDHNSLDIIHFDDLINSSAILRRYLNEGRLHFDDFASLMQDIFHIHYKHAIYFNAPMLRSVNYEIIQAMLKLPTLSSLRRRTVGSTTNTYLAFKLILDGLFETIRGRSIIQDIEQNLNLLNEMENLKTNIEHLKEIVTNIDMDRVFSKNELTMLTQYVNEYNNRNTSIITEKKMVRMPHR